MPKTPFSKLKPSAREHFRLHALGAAARLIEAAGQSLGSHEALLERFPFVVGYLDEMDELGVLLPDNARFDFRGGISAWQKKYTGHLPLRALSLASGLDVVAVELCVAIGLIEEDARFGPFFEAFQDQPGQQRPTLGLLNAWWREASEDGRIPAILRRLRELGLVEVVNPEAPRNAWAFAVPGLVWDALRADLSKTPLPYLRYFDEEELKDAPEPLLDELPGISAAELPGLVARRELDALVVRGAHHNGRRTLLRWLARETSRRALELQLTGKSELDAPRMRLAGPLALLLGALPILEVDPGPGETWELPSLLGLEGTVGITLGRSGGLRGGAVERSLTLNLEVPSPALRARHLGIGMGRSSKGLEELGACFRMTSGNLQRVARLAEAHARLAGRGEVVAADLREASRALGRQALDTLATRLPDAGDWTLFASASDTLRELRVLENRCRHREGLRAGLGQALLQSVNAGVRAAFQGPSGTGKTLAARLIASALQKDVYRIDLSAVVNKYIGETEKNLARIFAVAEELDVILLFDEGDALLARRTGVSNANDRYANLETNFLLQRLESFEGIIIITTNAPELIDSAFQRRMDVVVDFRSPEPPERWALLHLHLPAHHQVDQGLLKEVASRCQLTGGQIKNAVLHASLLALEDGAPVCSVHLENAVQREYRKSGGVCPIRVHAVIGRN